jgi:tetratricopeptide (TPR) repeat protein
MKNNRDNQPEESLINNKRTKVNETTSEDLIDALARPVPLQTNSASAQNIYQIGLAYKKSENYDEAVKQFKIAVELEPTNAEYCYQLGLSYMDSSRAEQAAELFNRAIKLDPNKAEYLYKLSVLYVQFRFPNRESEPIELINKAIELEPTNAEYSYQLGYILSDLGRVAESIEPLNRAIELGSINDNCFLQLGNAYIQTGRTREAINCFLKATQLAPTDTDSFDHLGNTLMSYATNKTGAEKYKLIAEALFAYAQGGDESYSKIIDFCDEGRVEPEYAPHPTYPFLRMAISAPVDYNPIKKAALPALKKAGSICIKDGEFLLTALVTALESFNIVFEIQKPTDPELWVDAEAVATKLLKVKDADFIEAFKESRLAQNVMLTGERDEENIKYFLQYKVYEYHLEATSLLPKEALLEWYEVNKIPEEIFNVLLSYIVPGETLKSTKKSLITPDVIPLFTEFNFLISMGDEEVYLAGEETPSS